MNGYNSRTYGNEARPQAGNSRDPGKQPNDREREINQDLIVSELSRERPIWLLSCYSPRADLPKQLFSGPDRELSAEEVRLRHYELASQGRMEEAIREAEAVYQAAHNQIESVLQDVAGAVKYLQNGYDEHPNRIDICRKYNEGGYVATNSNFVSPTPGPDTGTFGKPTTLAIPSAFGQPPTPGQKSLFGQAVNRFPQSSAPATFGQPSSMNNTNTNFGRPSAEATFGQPSAPITFGQPSSQAAFGQPSSINNQNVAFGQPANQTTFGQPSSLNTKNAAFGQPSGNGETSILLGQSAQTTNPTFDLPSNPFSQQQNGVNNTFGQPSGIFARGPGGETTIQKPLAQGTLGASSGLNLPTTFGFGQPNLGSLTSGGGKFGTSSTPSGFARSQTVGNNLPSKPQGQANGAQNASAKFANGKLQNWRGKQVRYIDNYPCFQENNGAWQRIWFPEGPPVWIKPESLSTDMPYDEDTEQRYKFAKQNVRFRDGILPLLPPKREWISWDF